MPDKSYVIASASALLLGALAMGAATVSAQQPPARQAAAVPDVTGPVWGKPDAFWYRKAVPGGNVWVVVDALHGVKEPLFDHQRLATELNIRTGDEFTALTLPFADPDARFVMKYDGSNAYVQEGARAIEFVLYDWHWRCELDNKWDWNKLPPTDYECTAKRPVVPQLLKAADASRVPETTRVSPDGQWEAFVSDHNIAVRPAGGGAPVRLTTDGTADFPYSLGSIQWADDSQSLIGYRVSRTLFDSASVTGKVEGLVVRGGGPVPGR